MRRVVIIAVALALSGCATPGKGGGGLSLFSPGSRQLGSAVSLIKQGETGKAKTLLASICEAPPVAGVTDEALFRLALLSIKPADPKESYQLLRRLKKQFPDSVWTVQAQPVLELVSGTEELRHQNRTLKGSNQSLGRANDTLNKTNESLTKDNEELKKRIEQLKYLDLELERKNR